MPPAKDGLPVAPPPRGAGSPAKLTPAVHRAIIYAVQSLGFPEGRAGEYARVSPSTPGKWKERGRRSFNQWNDLSPDEREVERPYVEFFEALRDADVLFEAANVKIIKDARARDWRAADRLLQIKHPERYGKRVMMGGDPHNPLPIPISAKAPVIYIPDNGRDPGLRKPDAKPKPKSGE